MFRYVGNTIDNVIIPRTTLGSNTVQSAISFMLQLAGALSLVYIIIGAVRFSTSAGDPQAVATARRTIIFSVIGLVVSVLGLTITAYVQNIAGRVANPNNPFFGANGIFTVLVEQLSFIVGVASVIAIIIGGIRYITSAGQPQSAEAARNTIVYAVVGIVVAVAAQVIVRFVLERI